jgi:hypothetical protein
MWRNEALFRETVEAGKHPAKSFCSATRTREGVSLASGNFLSGHSNNCYIYYSKARRTNNRKPGFYRLLPH